MAIEALLTDHFGAGWTTAATGRGGGPVSDARSKHIPAGRASPQNLVSALRECGELADAVEHFEGQELLDVLLYLDGLRYVMAESGQLLQGVVRGNEG